MNKVGSAEYKDPIQILLMLSNTFKKRCRNKIIKAVNGNPNTNDKEKSRMTRKGQG